MAFVITHIAAVTATLVWVIIEWLHRGKPTMFGAATGSIAGLPTITPASGFVGPMGALIIGAAAGSLCYLSLSLKPKLKFDDSLDAFGVHGVGGILGTIGAGLFAQKTINAAGAEDSSSAIPTSFWSSLCRSLLLRSSRRNSSVTRESSCTTNCFEPLCPLNAI